MAEPPSSSSTSNPPDPSQQVVGSSSMLSPFALRKGLASVLPPSSSSTPNPPDPSQQVVGSPSILSPPHQQQQKIWQGRNVAGLSSYQIQRTLPRSPSMARLALNQYKQQQQQGMYGGVSGSIPLQQGSNQQQLVGGGGGTNLSRSGMLGQSGHLPGLSALAAARFNLQSQLLAPSPVPGGPSNPPPEPEPEPEPHRVLLSGIWTVIHEDGRLEISRFDNDGVIQACSLCDMEKNIITGEDMLHPSYVISRVGLTILLLPQIFFIIKNDAAYIRIHKAFQRDNGLTKFASELAREWVVHTDERSFRLHVLEFTFRHTIGLLKEKINRLEGRRKPAATSQGIWAAFVFYICQDLPFWDILCSTCRWFRTCLRAVYQLVMFVCRMDRIQDLNRISELENLIAESNKMKDVAQRCWNLMECQDRRSCYLPHLITECEDMVIDMSRSLLQFKERRKKKTVVKSILGAVSSLIGSFVGVLATASIWLNKDDATEAQEVLWYTGKTAIGVAAVGGACSYFW